MTSPARSKVIAAFAALYIIWGSTYLAIRYAIETLPPFLMAGTRFTVAGLAMYLIMRARGEERPTRAQWRATTIIGGLLLLGGNGAVVWAEQLVPSGIAALLVATVPVWMVLLEALRPGGQRPTLGVVAGLFLGMVGLFVLVGPGEVAGSGRVNPIGAGVLLLGSLSWATGSIYSRTVKLPSSPLLVTGMQMLGGGVLLLAAGVVSGETASLGSASPSARSLLSLLYLVLFGSFVGYTAYVWLLRVSTPAKVATYAYVNPIVAVLLGWAFAGESVTQRTLIAAAIIVAAVALITTAQGVQRGRGRVLQGPRPADSPSPPARRRKVSGG